MIHTILLLMLMSLCVTLGLIPATSVPRGPESVAIRSVITAALAFVLTTVLCAFLVDPAAWGNQCAGPVNTGLIAGACTLVLPAVALLDAFAASKHHRKMAPLVSKFMLERFDEINQARDGLITNDELESAGKRLHLTADESVLLAYVKSEQGAIGHAIGSYMTTETTFVPTGRSAIPVTRSVKKYIYGICRADLDGYPERVTHEFRDWC